MGFVPQLVDENGTLVRKTPTRKESTTGKTLTTLRSRLTTGLGHCRVIVVSSLE